jgi:peptidoglycan/xylan/chitin deacetylase (PgdA/CDA1 family)
MRGHDKAPAAVAGLALVGAAAYWLPATSIVSGAARRMFGISATIEAGEGVALTFDDGPHPSGTPAVLETLAGAGVPATFFLVGEQVERRPALAAEIVAAGHEIGVHCHSHRNLMRLTPRQVRGDLRRAVDAIGAATGVAPVWYRPPYGILTTAALAVARRRGWQIVLWRRDGADWAGDATPREITGRILRDVAAGDVLLLHDADYYSAAGSWERTVQALPLVLDGLAARRLSVVRMSGGAPGDGRV